MHHQRWQHSHDYLRSMLLPLIIFLGLLCFLLAALSNAEKAASEEGLDFLEKSVMHATVQCYAIEGMYPPDMAYLEDNYGVIIDHDKFIVHYEVFASNILPDIKILEIAGSRGARHD